MKKAFLPLLVTSALVFVFAACNKENNNNTLRVRLTDGPVDLDKVNVDLQQVQVKMDRDSAKWVFLKTRAGVYNLLALQNGVDTMIAEGDVGPGVVKEIRLVLGDSNTVVKDGIQYPLTIPSGGASGLKIKISKPMRTTLDSLIVDFDAGLSVKQEQDGYKLRPVLRVK